MRETFKRSLKTNRWDSINFCDQHEYTNDAIVARWKEETDKWKKVRIFSPLLTQLIVRSRKEPRMR